MPPTEALTSIPVTSEATVPTLGTPAEATQHAINMPDNTPFSANVASTLCNLLPIAESSGQSSGNSIYIGEGLPPVSPKLAEKICRWEFVDMAELLPEFWSLPAAMKQEGQPNTQPSPFCQSRKLTDLASWVQCFAIYVRVLAGSSPEVVSELMACLIQIVRVSQDFGGLAWVSYDLTFCHQAAATGTSRGQKSNLSLYSICFLGAARVSK